MKSNAGSYGMLVVCFLAVTDYVLLSSGARSFTFGVAGLPFLVPLLLAGIAIGTSVVLLPRHRNYRLAWLCCTSVAALILFGVIQPQLQNKHRDRMLKLVCMAIEEKGLLGETKVGIAYSSPTYGRTDVLARTADQNFAFAILGDPGFEEVSVSTPTAGDMQRDLKRITEWVECRKSTNK